MLVLLGLILRLLKIKLIDGVEVMLDMLFKDKDCFGNWFFYDWMSIVDF